MSDDIQAQRYPAATYWLERAMRAEARRDRWKRAAKHQQSLVEHNYQAALALESRADAAEACLARQVDITRRIDMQLHRQAETIRSTEARIVELEKVVEGARRFAVAVPYYHMLTDYVEYEIAYQRLIDLLGITEHMKEWDRYGGDE